MMNYDIKPELWDFDENINYILVGTYKVLAYPDFIEAYSLLKKIKNKINRCFMSISQNEMITPEVELLLTTPFHLQEMQLKKNQLQIKFEGLNKPKKVHLTNEIDIGPDGKLRASYRLIFLTLRKNGKLKSINSLKNLIAHELTHTALNHVRWRDDDHSGKFNCIYNMILRNL